MKDCLHIIVKGRVQGVYFRAYTQKQAVKLNLSGFVRNLADGTVEIVASGHPEDLQKLVAWCRKGPVLAKVSEVSVTAHDTDEHFAGFEIR
ncbi:acylphosphatase [Methylomonas sp. SURF-1]|uniref:Acylphosphatase n=1 Tax=Methylomonas aurea TaxID=2952224 RepID=A0ABT1UH31_9GAMM|nr:acylphosphatase [Methylomonas sp. SURF-1]MCQ8181495.1 acylphosphatase [Methylomonas sp. SURF-1]